MPRLFSTFRRSRSLLKNLQRLADAEERQAVALERLAEKFAPKVDETDDPAVKGRSAVSYVRDEEQGRIQDFVDRVMTETGRLPTEDEIAHYLDGVPL